VDSEWKVLDLSSKSFDQFLEYFFARTVVSDEEQYDYFLTDPSGQRCDEAVSSAPTVLVSHMARLFTEFGKIVPKYSLAQVDQAVRGMLGANLRLYEFLFDASIPLVNRLECVRSMYHVYSDFVAAAVVQPDPKLSGFFMWWDSVLHGFWTPPRPSVASTYRGDPSRLNSESRALLDAMFVTLKRILNLQHTEAQRCALHGLGHLYHPGVRETVQHYIDTNKSELSLAWLEECRDGTVM
jgi:hypothetical protein